MAPGALYLYGDGITFWALGEIVRLTPAYTIGHLDVALQKLEAVLPNRVERPWLRARLMALLGLDASDSAAQDELFAAWRRFLSRSPSRDPWS